MWGDDLRIEGVVVEYLDGVDDLADKLRDFGPGPDRRVGVLVDHLVPGSKESRIADAVRRSPVGQHVLIVGHPFVDVWAAVKPERLGLAAWPDVPRDDRVEEGRLRGSAGRTATRPTSPAPGSRSSARVTSYADLEPGPARARRGAHRLRDRRSLLGRPRLQPCRHR